MKAGPTTSLQLTPTGITLSGLDLEAQRRRRLPARRQDAHGKRDGHCQPLGRHAKDRMSTMEPDQPLPRIMAERAGDICRLYRLNQELEPLLADEPTPLVFMDRLLFQERHVPEAVAFLAHALPKREAVWWGCLCVPVGLERGGHENGASARPCGRPSAGRWSPAKRIAAPPAMWPSRRTRAGPPPAWPRRPSSRRAASSRPISRLSPASPGHGPGSPQCHSLAGQPTAGGATAGLVWPFRRSGHWCGTATDSVGEQPGHGPAHPTIGR